MGMRIVARLLGRLLLAYAIFIVLPLGYALIYHEPVYISFAFSVALTGALGAALYFIGQEPGRIGLREGFLFVAVSWLLASILGALPYWLSGWVPSLLDAVFESVSGLTTTGATIVPDVEILPRSLLLWRSMTQWLGGMGIIVLFVVFLANVGADAMNLFRAEMPGPTVERVMPRIRTMAGILWRLYIGFTAVEIVVLLLAGMAPFDAVNHAFTAVATGGFSTKNASIEHFDSLAIEIALVFFMFLSGGNFALYYLAWQKGFRQLVANSEYMTYLGIMVTAVLSLAAILHTHTGAGLGGLRDALFTGVSIMTSTGFTTANFDQWPPAAKIIILLLMFIGGCAGSTAGGIKVVRLLILLKDAVRALLHAIHPRLVTALKIDRKPVEAGILHMVLQFFFLFMLIFFVSVLLVAATGVDPFDAMGAVAASLGNVGPSFGIVSPATTYAALPSFAKAVLTANMLLGRLELFTLLVLLHPEFWQPYMKNPGSLLK
jgi:trk system potassium uptake protein TrkH